MPFRKGAGWLTLFAAIAVACAPAAAPSATSGGGAAPAPSTPKDIVIINSGIPPGMDNRFVVTSNNAAGIVLNLYAGVLVTSDNTGARLARLAEAVPSLENGLWKLNPDNTMETRLTLRSGASWHDGAPLTSRDLLFMDEVARDRSLPQAPIPGTVQGSSFAARQYIDRIESIDDHMVAVHWKQPYVLASNFSPDMMPTHILEQTFRQNPQALTSHPWLTTEYVGTGPFKLKEFVPSTYLDLTAFDRYVLGRPKIDNVRIEFITDGGTMLSRFLAGAADLATGTGPNVTQAQQLKTQNWDGEIAINLGATHVHLFAQYIDPFNPVLTDKRFHKALMYALDRQELVDSIEFGYGGVEDIPWPRSDPHYNDLVAPVEKYPYDPQRAAAMFQAVGYAKGPDGFLRNTTTGRRLEQVEFRTTAEQPFQVAMLAAMSNYFKEAGLDILQVPIPQERTADRAYRVSGPGLEELQFSIGPSSTIGWMHSSKIPTPQNGYVSGNYPRYSNRDWDALIDRFAVTIPENERYQVLKDIFVWVQDNLMDMPIIYGVGVQFASKRMVVPDLNPIWTAETWDLK